VTQNIHVDSFLKIATFLPSNVNDISLTDHPPAAHFSIDAKEAFRLLFSPPGKVPISLGVGEEGGNLPLLLSKRVFWIPKKGRFKEGDFG
jgi:hypothetical protein